MMTVDVPTYHDNSFLVPDVLPIFYNAPIPYKHWQLRSLLCSPAPNVLYYPTNSRIFSLNTETRERKLVAVLHFEPRCIGAKYGWVCVGGVENGQFAAIRIADKASAASNASDLRNLVDTSVNEMGLSYGSYEPDLGIEINTDSMAKYVRFTELGGSIVNSITLHKQKESGDDGDVVAILTNNDKTVRIFSLTKFQLITTLNLPFHTNHASISPSGRHLVVVGDSPKVIFYEPSPLYTRKEIKSMYTGWIPSSDESLTTGSEALISTNFSPSSNLCAVASQDGTVTIFDMQRIRDMKKSRTNKQPPVLSTIPSSRPRMGVGAVRSVQFSPSPWDLLVWAEHSGRISIADARTGFAKRQVINVNVCEGQVNEAQLLGSADDDRDMFISSPMSSSMSMRISSHEDEAISLPHHVPSNMEDGRFAHRDTRPIRSHSRLAMAALGENVSSRLLHLEPSSMQSAITNRPQTPNDQRVSSTSNSSSSSSFLYRYRLSQEINRLRDSTRDGRQHLLNANISPTEVLTLAEDNDTAESFARRVAPLYSASERPSRSPRVTGSNVLSRAYLTEQIVTRRGDGTMTTQDVRRRSGSDELDITGCTLSCDGTKLYVATTIGIIEYPIDLTSRRVFARIQPR